MSSYKERADRVTALLPERNLDLLLVSNLVNVRYMCGFEGTNALVVVGASERVFVTDFRYFERARSEVPDYDVVRGKQDLLESVNAVVKDRLTGSVRLGFDDAHLTVRAHARLRERLPSGFRRSSPLRKTAPCLMRCRVIWRFRAAPWWWSILDARSTVITPIARARSRPARLVTRKRRSLSSCVRLRLPPLPPCATARCASPSTQRRATRSNGSGGENSSATAPGMAWVSRSTNCRASLRRSTSGWPRAT